MVKVDSGEVYACFKPAFMFLQYMAFHAAKGHLSACKSIPFAMPFVAFDVYDK